MDRHPPPRVVIRRLHPVLAVEPGKHNLADVGARLDQRSSAQPRIRQVLPKPVHNIKDRLRRLVAVRHLHRQRSWPRDRLDKKASRYIRRDPDLPRLQHNVPRPASPRILLLRFIQVEIVHPALLHPDLQQASDQQIAYRLIFHLPVEPGLVIQMRPKLFQKPQIIPHS